MADPNEMEIDLFGDTYTLNLEAGCLRLAQMKGKGIEPGSLEELEDFDLGTHRRGGGPRTHQKRHVRRGRLALHGAVPKAPK
jgi:hypothetical protein